MSVQHEGSNGRRIQKLFRRNDTLVNAQALQCTAIAGACPVGKYQFFVCEYAAQGSIDSVVASQLTTERGIVARRLLHEVALGLQYLHAKDVVHADMRCCNILVDALGVVKLADFGFCSIKIESQPCGASVNVAKGACRWMASECLAGEMPTITPNVYSLAMCVIEVVSGKLPWSSEATDAEVRLRVLEGLLPPRPADCFSDSEWDFIERMCCHDPMDRITMSDALGLFVQSI